MSTHNKEWTYCPECGSEEIHHEEGDHKQCATCYQEWFADIDYTNVVRGHLAARNRRSALTASEAPATEQAPPTFNSIGIAENWSVTVEACGERVLCISDQHYAGVSDLEQYKETIANCARHLLAFIGEQAPAGEVPSEEQQAWEQFKEIYGQDVQRHPNADWRGFRRGWQCRAALSTPPVVPPSPDIEAAAKKLSECMDYPWEHMPEQGRQTMRESARLVLLSAAPAAPQGEQP